MLEEQCEIPRRPRLLGMTPKPGFHTDSEAPPFHAFHDMTWNLVIKDLDVTKTT
jgi:hypothetical protein